ncbi:hypothetical protein CH063_10993 [Colletotrichum higginsianum]|uniref:Uncharacterized protein n=1 Tax=Colletotrichum higginsianum (strain IMI 349063) TaxID=759273 RepID=H1VJM2_COLHI|nr:hypothetical protein CH063_10993 [Colletotrichum higginsianum]
MFQGQGGGQHGQALGSSHGRQTMVRQKLLRSDDRKLQSLSTHSGRHVEREGGKPPPNNGKVDLASYNKL